MLHVSAHRANKTPWGRGLQTMPPSHFSSMQFKNYPPIYTWVFQVVSFLQVSPLKRCMHLSSPPYVLHALLLLLTDVWTNETSRDIFKSDLVLSNYLHSHSSTGTVSRRPSQRNGSCTLLRRRFLVRRETRGQLILCRSLSQSLSTNSGL